MGMVVSFVGFSFLLLVVLNQFVEFADYMRIATYYVLFLFGVGFMTSNKTLQLIGAVLGGFFFQEKGWIVVTIAQTIGAIAMELGTKVATYIQQFGSNVQQKTRGELGENNPFTAFVMGLTMGLVWVPCAGPALGFAFTLVREQPGPMAALYLSAYALGTAVPLIIIGYGGQAAVHSVRALSKYSGRIKQVAGAMLILTAVAFNFDTFMKLQIWLLENTSFGNLGVDIESRLFGEPVEDSSSISADSMKLPNLPKITRAPEFTGLGTWFNSEPLTMEGLKGKVVLVDFWTYSCINCIRTLPYIEGYWDKFKDKPFVLIGVHTPEFVFEKSEKNVADAIAKHGLTYPIVQDNDFGTWRAFANRYWPAKYLIDAEGYIRYTHFGEGAYEETDLAIQSLLKEIGVEVSGETLETEASSGGKNKTPETYLGSRSWPTLQNAKGNPSDETISYEAPARLEMHKYALVGDWQLMDEERQTLMSDAGEIRMKFLGSEINLVLGLAEGATPAEIDVEVDGKKTKTFTVDFHDSYNLFTGEYGEHEITLTVRGKGLEGYAFTFGAN